MLESLKTHLSWINLVLNAIGLVGIPVLIVLGILKPFSNAKTRMKKKIRQELTKEANKGELLFPEIRLRDNLLSQRVFFKKGVFLQNFYTTFIESIRELATEEEIVCVRNWDLEFFIAEVEKNYPPYNSKVKKTPANYGLKMDDPSVYLALNSQEGRDYLEKLKRRRDQTASRMRRANPY